MGGSNRVLCVQIDGWKAIGFYVYRLMSGKQYGSMCTDWSAESNRVLCVKIDGGKQ